MIDRTKSSTKRPEQAGKVRRPGTRAVASLLPQVTAKALGKRGFGQAGLVTDWSEIVGADVARWVVPERLSFPRGARTGATLQVRVAGAAALEVQHAAPSIVERINHYLGHAAVARLAIRQGPVPGPAQIVAREDAAGPATPAQSAWVDARLANVPEGDLRAALAGLGRALARDHGVAEEPNSGARRREI
ncbi:MAG: DciA family protein [Alphaproteobacteria bacterium]|nr:DciA family protein [Alphaproteobacteria bacterium]